jgi:hypothetical protein
MRTFLIVFSYINLFLYILIYALYDYIAPIVGFAALSTGAQSFLRVLLLVVAGFFIGLVASLFRKARSSRSSFDYNLFLLLGLAPFILLLLSEGSMSSFLIRVFFRSSKSLSEAAFYVFSRTSIYAVWYGLSIGLSVTIGSGVQKQRMRASV